MDIGSEVKSWFSDLNVEFFKKIVDVIASSCYNQ